MELLISAVIVKVLVLAATSVRVRVVRVPREKERWKETVLITRMHLKYLGSIPSLSETHMKREYVRC